MGVGVASKARACGVSEVTEEKSKAAKVAWDAADLRGSELGFWLKMFLVVKRFLLEKKGRGIGADVHLEVVFGVGGECRILVPKKLEESKVLVVEAMAPKSKGSWCFWYSLFPSSPPLLLSLH